MGTSIQNNQEAYTVRVHDTTGNIAYFTERDV